MPTPAMVEKHYGHLAKTYVADAIRAAAPRFGVVAEENVVAIGEGMSCDGSPPTANQWADFVTKLRFARAIQLSAAKAASLPEDLHADFAAIWLAFEAVLELVTD